VKQSDVDNHKLKLTEAEKEAKIKSELA